MSYWLYEVKVDQEYGESEWVPTKELGNVLEYTYEVPAGSRQGMHYVGIIAANKAGQSRALRHGAYNLGTLYNAPVSEDFIGSRGPVLHYTPLIVLSSSGDEGAASWEWVQPEVVNPDYWNADTPYAMIAYADAEEGGRGQIELPKFSIKDVQDPAFSLKLWNSNPRGNVNVYVSGHGSERYRHLYEVPVTGNGWSTVQVAIPEEYRKMAWLQFAIDATLPDYDTYVLVGGYGIGTKDESGVSLQPVAEGKVFGGKGMIGVTGFSGADVAVHTVDGALAERHASISDYETISLGAPSRSWYDNPRPRSLRHSGPANGYYSALRAGFFIVNNFYQASWLIKLHIKGKCCNFADGFGETVAEVETISVGRDGSGGQIWLLATTV